jgi:segregation and condensation protein B
VERPLRLVTANPLDQLARTLEALLVVANAPLPVEELTAATEDDQERVEMALGLLAERYHEGRSGIVLESVAGGWAFRASRAAAEACGRLFERPVQRGLSQAALETVAVAGLTERGLITEAGREDGAHGGAVKYKTTPMFERVFGLESLSQLPRLDDLPGDVDDLRERLHAVAEQRSA